MKASEIKNFDKLLDEAERNALSDWEMDFVQDVMDKYDRYEDDANISEKQLEKLEKIANR